MEWTLGAYRLQLVSLLYNAPVSFRVADCVICLRAPVHRALEGEAVVEKLHQSLSGGGRELPGACAGGDVLQLLARVDGRLVCLNHRKTRQAGRRCVPFVHRAWSRGGERLAIVQLGVAGI